MDVVTEVVTVSPDRSSKFDATRTAVRRCAAIRLNWSQRPRLKPND